MVNTERHGDTTLDYKPCRKNCACSEYSVRGELNPLFREQNGSKVKVHAQNTSAVTGNNTHLLTSVAQYTCHKNYTEQSSYSSIIHTPSEGEEIDICEQYQYLDSLPYLELPLLARSRSKSAIESLLTIRPILLLTRLSKTCSVRFFVISIIISLLLMCRSCVCFPCSETIAVSMARNEYLTPFNETNMAAISGQCLTVTESLIGTLCEKPVKERKVLLRDSNYYTNFCGLPLDQILSKEEKNLINCARDNGCARVVNRLLAVDEELSKMYCQFTNVVDRIDCMDYFPTKGSCNHCKIAYKRWLCSVYNTYYVQDEPIKPCIEFCDQVSENCPFFRPSGDGVIGEPGFLCKDTKFHADVDDDAAANAYGPAGCCFKPCQVFEMSGTGSQDCPELTPNCTFSTNTTTRSASVSHEPNHVISIVLICWILCSFIIGQVQYPYDFIIGLT